MGRAGSNNRQKEFVKEYERLCSRNNRHQFHSMHEGYAVLREEVDECQDEHDAMILHTNDLWQAVKHDDNTVAAEKLKLIEATAIQLAAEAVQVAAMARKAMTVATTENT